MAKATGLGMKRFVSGVDISGDVQAIDEITTSMEPIDQTGIDVSAHERAAGLRDGKIVSTGYVNPTRAHLVLSALPLTDIQDMILFGQTVGAETAMQVGKQLNYDPQRSDDGSLIIKCEVDSNGFGVEWGVLLTAGLRTDTTGTNGAGLDTLASAAFGAQLYAQVTALTGTNVVLTVQDSADNVTFVNLTGAAFTSVTAAPAVQRLQLGGTATVRRYLRVVSSGTFTSASFVVGVVKNPVSQPF